MSGPVLRILVVDDHPVVRQGTRGILESAGLEVVGEAGTAEDALELLADTVPDIVLVDVRLPGASGIELVAELKRRQPDTKAIVLSSYADPSYVTAALGAGANGYLLKTSSDDELVSAVRSAALGTTVLDPSVSAGLASSRPAAMQPLTDREREIVELVITGVPNKVIAHQLAVSKRTVDAHLGHLFRKLGVSSRAELVAWAARHGMVDQ
jgi:DNA-binding NarL/FixJ family response regulator